MRTVLSVRDLSVSYGYGHRVQALDAVSLDLSSGEALGIVGESGSGKSTLALAIARLLPELATCTGAIDVDNLSVLDAGSTELRSFRRDKLGFVFQNAVASLNPTTRVGKQLATVIGCSPSHPRVLSLLADVGLSDVRSNFPHQLSGGMAQRVAIAIAIARHPQVILADEPTSALDTSVKGQILSLLRSIVDRLSAGLVLVTHDFHAVREICDRTAVMYGGRIVELDYTSKLLARPYHPYTAALLKSAAGNESGGERLRPIEGTTQVMRPGDNYCAFAPRCPLALDICRNRRPQHQIISGRMVACHRAEEAAATPNLLAEVLR
jgi:oligopeptide/dipeptide ABC transporter ATP-binding protein